MYMICFDFFSSIIHIIFKQQDMNYILYVSIYHMIMICETYHIKKVQSAAQAGTKHLDMNPNFFFFCMKYACNCDDTVKQDPIMKKENMEGQNYPIEEFRGDFV